MNKMIVVMFVLAFVVKGAESQARESSDATAANPLNTYMENLHSEDLKPLCLKYYPLLGNLNLSKAKPAIDFFYDLQCIDILVPTLRSKSFLVKVYALEAIFDLVEEGDRDMAQILVAELDRVVGSIYSGGSDVQEPFRIYKKNLVKTLVKLSKVDAGNIDMKSDQSIRDYIRQVQVWLDSK